MQLTNDQIIHVDSYRRFADYQCITKEQIDSVPSSGSIFCPQDECKFLFKHMVDKDLCGPYLIISAESDFGLCYQKDFPVNPDLPKALHRIDFSEFYTNKEDYLPLYVYPACHKDQCNPQDQYSLRCYHYTHATFNEIPPQVKFWYSANLSLKDERCDCLPLGILNKELKITNGTKNKLLYVNFSDITLERKSLKDKFEKLTPNHWFTFKDKISQEEFYNDLNDHLFVLCPAGNSWDAYRILESLYLGCIPIVKKSIWASYFADMPILFVDKWSDINEKVLLDVADQIKGKDFSIDKISLDYWESKIRYKWEEIVNNKWDEILHEYKT